MLVITTLFQVLKTLFNYYFRARVKGLTIAGVETITEWDGEELVRYMSYAPDPYSLGIVDDLYFDDYGVEDSDIFYYLDGIWETIRFMLAPSPDGWRIKKVWLIVIDD